MNLEKNDNNIITNWLEKFRNEFPEEAKSMNVLVEYEALISVILNMIDENPDDINLISKIKAIILSFNNEI